MRDTEREREIGDPREENLRVISIRIYRERAFVYARTRVILAEGRWFRAFGHLALLRVSWMKKKKKNDKGERGKRGESAKGEKRRSLALFLYRNDGSHESSKPEGRIFSTTRKRREKETAHGGWVRNDG